MWKLYTLITTALGAQRRLIRRIAALSLLFLGVHAAADHLDDLLYPLIDALDLALDQNAAALLAWLSENGGMTPADALARSERFALWLDLPEKDHAALVLALVVELLLDVLLLGFAWGRHVDGSSPGLLGELRDSARQLVAALSPLDVERLAVMPSVLGYAFLGAVSAALAAEQIARAGIARVAPDFLWGSSVAAACGIGAACLLVWRFAPDLLHGALLRAQARGDDARARAATALDAANRHAHPLRRRLSRARVLARLGLRGTWLLCVALPLALAGIASSDVGQLVARAIPTPGDAW